MIISAKRIFRKCHIYAIFGGYILNKWSKNVYMHLSWNGFCKKFSTLKKHQVEQFLRYLQNSFCRSSQNLVAKKLQSPFLMFGLKKNYGEANAKKGVRPVR